MKKTHGLENPVRVLYMRMGSYTKQKFVYDIHLSSWCYKTFFGWNLDFPKIKKLNKVCFADWTCTKTLKRCYFQLNNIQTLFICSKVVYSGCFGLRGNLDFPGFLQIKFYNISCRSYYFIKKILVLLLTAHFAFPSS